MKFPLLTLLPLSLLVHSLSAVDTDGDGVSDQTELSMGTDPSDGQEYNGTANESGQFSYAFNLYDDWSKYLIDSYQAEVYSEIAAGNATFWRPTVRGEEGYYVYQIPVNKPILSAKLKAHIYAWTQGATVNYDQNAYAYLDVSSDGETWHQVDSMSAGVMAQNDVIDISEYVNGAVNVFVRSRLLGNTMWPTDGLIFAQSLRTSNSSASFALVADTSEDTPTNSQDSDGDSDSDGDGDGIPDYLENNQMHKLSLNNYGTNFLYLNAHQAGSFSDYDNLSIVNLDTGETFYEDDFSSDNNNWILLHCNDKRDVSSAYVNDSPLARIENGLLRLESVGYQQNGSGGYDSETGALLKLNMPENFSVSFDIKRNQWAGHTYVKMLGAPDNYVKRLSSERIDEYAYLFQWGGTTFRRVSTLSSDLSELLSYTLSGGLSTGQWHRLEFVKQDDTVTINVNDSFYSQHNLPEYDYAILGDIFADSDEDGLLDEWEIENFGDLLQDASSDPDNDNATNIFELNSGTDPLSNDTDGDGLSDGVETNTGEYIDASDTGTDPLVSDTDGDGLRDGAETNTRVYINSFDTGTHPLFTDSDSDGLSDYAETNTGLWTGIDDTGTDPNRGDTDGDGIVDGRETNTGVYVSTTSTGTDPHNQDSDGDGFSDRYEVEVSNDPNDSGDSPDAIGYIETAVEYTFHAALGGIYRIEHTESLDFPNWVIVEDGIVGEGGLVERFYSTDDYSRRFFRVIRTDQ